MFIVKPVKECDKIKIVNLFINFWDNTNFQNILKYTKAVFNDVEGSLKIIRKVQ